jgi:hypothetical protein
MKNESAEIKQKSSLDTLIDKFTQLKEEEKEFAIDILNKIIADSRRNTIANRAKNASRNLKAGKVKRGSSKDLFNDLEND